MAERERQRFNGSGWEATLAEKAPMPPWWVERSGVGSLAVYTIYGGTYRKPVYICHFTEMAFSNARELADLIVQRTKQS